MAKKKIYSVRKGNNPGIYDSWSECEEQIKGFSGAEYKGFFTKKEAEEYLEEVSEKYSNEAIIENNEVVNYDKLVNEALKEGRVVAFTDGSYKNGVSSFGVCILEPNTKDTIEISDIVRTNRFLSSNNIAPEIMAVINAFDWALSKGYTEITIFHDYEGISKWANDEWKTGSDIAKWYKGRLESTYSDILDIRYVKVPGHSDIFYNEEADRLAGEARRKNVKPQFKISDTYFSCQSVGEQDFNEIMRMLYENPDIEINEEEEIGVGRMLYSLKKGNEKLKISYYKRNSRTLIQGNHNSLFSLFLSFYTEKIPDYDLVQAYSQMHKQTIKKDDVNSTTESLNLPSDFPKDAIKLIKQAISEKISLENRKKEETYDYCHYIFPACRALEGTVKYLFHECGTDVKSTQNVGCFFDKDPNDAKRYILNAKKYEGQKYKNKLEVCYNVYCTHRHVLGHFGELFNNPDCESSTYMIEDPQEAVATIDYILQTIKF